MPSPENAELLDAMANQIRAALDDVSDVTVQVEPRWVTSAPDAIVDMWPGDTARDGQSAAFDDDGGFFFTVRARVPMGDEVAGQDLLLGLMDDINGLSVGQALYDDPTLGGLAADLAITNQTGYVNYSAPEGGGMLLGCQWTVLVIRADS